jgi:hypothetical protein
MVTASRHESPRDAHASPWDVTDRHQVEHHDVVYTLDLGDGLRGGGDEPDEPAPDAPAGSDASPRP